MVINDIKIGNPIEPWRNKYVLHVETMHGDADLETVQTSVFEDIKEAMEYWGIISVYFDLEFDKSYIRRDEMEDKLMTAIDVRGKELGVDYYPSEVYNDLVGSDAVCGHEYSARIQAMWFTYFDENGSEHVVEEPKQLGWRRI